MNNWDKLKELGEVTIKGANPKLSTVKEVQKVLTPAEHAASIASKRAALKAIKTAGKAKGIMPKLPGKGGGALGLFAGLLAAAQTGDASAAIPVLNEAEELGPDRGSVEGRLERGELSPEEYKELMKKMSQ